MSERTIALGPGREFDAVRAILARLGDRAAGVGDDAAVVAMPRGDRLVVSVDATLEGVHFRRGWLTPREIGRRATAAALSDLAAMGALPVGVLTALEVPDAWRDEVEELALGIGEAVQGAGTHVVGGNTTRGPVLGIVTTALGAALTPLRRSGARPGDRIYVTGRLGGPGAALQAWLAGREPDGAHRARFADPRPRLHEARWLAAAGASACIDVSDGLASDLGHLAAASGVDIAVALDALPCMPGVEPEDAARSGEEYELALSSPAPLDVEAFAVRFGLALTEIGRARRADGVPQVVLLREGARVARLPGHDHFSE